MRIIDIICSFAGAIFALFIGIGFCFAFASVINQGIIYQWWEAGIVISIIAFYFIGFVFCFGYAITTIKNK